MIVRKIKANEAKRAREFWALAFEYSFDSDKTPEEFHAQITQAPKARDERDWQHQWAAFDDDDQTMLSTFITLPYNVYFDGSVVPMMGIGGVATLPQHRRQGGIRACFEQALPDMADNGAVLSYLYPFSTAYYRKFGYELGCDRTLWKLRLDGIPRLNADGGCLLAEGAHNHTEKIMQIDAAWQRRYNMMVSPDPLDYQWIQNANPFKDKEYTYIYQSVNGDPMGYVTFAPEDKTRDLACKRFAFSGVEGLKGLLILLASLKADHPHVRFYLPTDVDLCSLLPEWSFGMVERQQELFGMVRVLDVEKALSIARMRGEGRFSIAVTDPQIEKNNGTFTVAFSEGQANHIEKTSAAPDAEMSIQAFSRMLLGRCDLDAYPALEDVKLNCDASKAAQVFYRKPLYISSYF